jgi:hypothetical protein
MSFCRRKTAEARGKSKRFGKNKFSQGGANVWNFSYWAKWFICSVAVVVFALARVLQNVFTGLGSPWDLLLTVIVVRYAVDLPAFGTDQLEADISYILRLLFDATAVTVVATVLATTGLGPYLGLILAIIAVPPAVDLLIQLFNSLDEQTHVPETRHT